MNSYFALQKKRTDRMIIDFGLSPNIGYLLAIIAIAISMKLILSRLTFGPWLIAGLAIWIIRQLDTPQKANFLLNMHTTEDYRNIRRSDHLLMALPFLMAMLLSQSWFPLCAALIATYITTLLKPRSTFAFVLPTPFSRHPFEFIVGFRKSWWVVLISLILIGIGIAVDNARLAVFAQAIVSLSVLSYYDKLEKSHDIWIYDQSAHQFLMNKIIVGIKYHTVLILIPTIINLILFPDMWIPISIIILLFNLYLILMVLTKYSRYPSQPSLPEVLILLFSFTLPPVMLITIPLLYKKSVKSLKYLLPC